MKVKISKEAFNTLLSGFYDLNSMGFKFPEFIELDATPVEEDIYTEGMERLYGKPSPKGLAPFQENLPQNHSNTAIQGHKVQSAEVPKLEMVYDRKGTGLEAYAELNIKATFQRIFDYLTKRDH